MKEKAKKVLVWGLALILALNLANVPSFEVQAAPKSVSKVTLKIGSKNVTKKTYAMNVGDNKKISVKATPAAAVKSISYKTSDKKIATVKKGTITAKKAGTAKITVTVTGKNKKKKSTYMKVKISNVAVKSITATIPKTTLSVGEKTTIKASVKPSNATNKKLSYKSSNTKAATVSSKGQVVGKATGKATITVSSSSNKKKKKTFNITVKAKTVEVTGINTSTPSLTMAVRDSRQIVANVVPSNAANKTLKYRSEDETIAFVNQAGAVTGMSAGTTEIIVSSANKKSIRISVTVVNISVSSITLSSTNVALGISETSNLKATILPKNATNTALLWSSSAPEIVNVTQEGVITGLRAGKAIITVSAKDGSGASATCEVTVKGSEEIKEGISIRVTNPYEGNNGLYENTVLAGRDMAIQAQLIENGAPIGNRSLRISMKPLYGNASNRFAISGNPSSNTDENGIANFVISPTSNTITATSGFYQSYELTVTDSTTNENSKLIVRFVCVAFPGITIDNIADDSLVPVDNASHGETGYYETASMNSTVRDQQYVVSQQVSAQDKPEENHKIEMSAQPLLVLPPTEGETTRDKWEVSFTGTDGNGTSGPCSVYNNVTNTKTTTYVTEVPAGLQSMTLDFKKVDLSAYTTMFIEVKDAATAETIVSKEVTHLQNELDKNSSIQLGQQFNTESIIVISLVSQGVVDTEATGYVLEKIEGPYTATQISQGILEPIEGSVKWSDVSNELRYEKISLSYAEAQKYIANQQFLQSTYKYSCEIPVFPYSGNAIITVKDANDQVKGYFVYPTEKSRNDNMNVLAPAPGERSPFDNEVTRRGQFAILVSHEEVDTRVPGTVQPVNDGVIIDSARSGFHALKAAISVKGLNEDELNSQQNGELYSYVQWGPVPDADTLEKSKDYFAVEGQKVMVTAQLFDSNGNAKTDSGNTITFMDKDGNEIKKIGDQIGGDESGNNKVSVTSFSPVTDSQGKITIELTGNEIAYVEGLKAEASYKVGLSFESGVEPSANITAGNIYWVDLGTTFVNSAVKEDNPYRKTSFASGLDDITVGAATSTSPVGKTWQIGFLPVARSKKFNYSNLSAVDRSRILPNEFISVEGVSIVYTMNGQGQLLKTENVAELASNKTGQSELSGLINNDAIPNSDITFKFYDENSDAVTYKNIGVRNASVLNTGLKYVMDWAPSGLNINILTPDGEMLDINTASKIYLQVIDNYNNPINNIRVACTCNGILAFENGATEVTGTTNEKGYFTLNLNAPGEKGRCNITFKVEGSKDQSVSIEYSDLGTSQAAFGILADNTNPNIPSAVIMKEKNSFMLYFTQPINANTLRKEQFKFTQQGASEVSYVVTDVTVPKGVNNAVMITLDKEITNYASNHVVTYEAYTDPNTDIIYNLMDTYGRKVTESSSRTFIPSEKEAEK